MLDLFCGAGGAAVGYHRAGFDVVGVDLKNQRHYPFDFMRAHALEVLASVVAGEWPELAALHGSPPCQRYSKAVSKVNREKHPDLVGQVRELFVESGLPYVIENVVGAPLVNPVQLCGSAFGMPIQRHRLFETTFPVLSPGCAHGAYPRIYPPAWNRTTKLRVLSLSGGWTNSGQGSAVKDQLEEHKRAMGIDHEVTVRELSEAIPPAYTEFVGARLLESLGVRT